MNLIPLHNIDLPELSIFQQLRDNIISKENAFVADSPKVVNLILETDIEVKSILATQEYYDEFHLLIEKKQIASLYVASKSLMQTIVGHKLHHNAMLHGIRPQTKQLDELDNEIIMLDNISSSENVGSIARSARALGVNSYVLPKQGPHPFGRRSLRVSMGHSAYLNIHLYNNIKKTIKRLKELGYTIYAAEITQDSIPLSEVKIPSKWVLIVGHEGDGISEEILALCSQTVHVEMQANVKSLNVGVAASIMMHHFSKSSQLKHNLTL
jgi:tRNA G18 (ribose-2'-O)-methylase SpoU